MPEDVRWNKVRFSRCMITVLKYFQVKILIDALEQRSGWAKHADYMVNAFVMLMTE